MRPYVKPANHVENRMDRRLAINQSGKRQCVVIVRERNGKSLPAVFKSEGAALSWIKSRVANGTVESSDEANAWNDQHGCFEMKRINHEQVYSADGACTNMAEEYFSRLRRAEIEHHHHIAGTICSATRKRVRGGKVIAGCRMAIRPARSQPSPCGAARQSILADIGNVTRPQIDPEMPASTLSHSNLPHHDRV